MKKESSSEYHAPPGWRFLEAGETLQPEDQMVSLGNGVLIGLRRKSLNLKQFHWREEDFELKIFPPVSFESNTKFEVAFEGKQAEQFALSIDGVNELHRALGKIINAFA